MFYYLWELKDIFFGFNIFRYITFRAFMAGVFAFLFCLLTGKRWIRFLEKMRLKENIRTEQDAPGLHQLHKHKQGIPTMGGIIIVPAILATTLLWADILNPYIIVVVLSTLWLGFIGILDDRLKLKNNGKKGLSARAKIYGQAVLGLIIGCILYLDPMVSSGIEIPFFKDLIIDIGFLYIPFAILLITVASNAVNITDGIDGLASGCTVILALTYAVFSYVVGHRVISDYLIFNYIPGSGELTVFCVAIAGTMLGFLWFNTYPAQVFMGDTGSLAIGGLFAILALILKKEIVLLIAGGVFFMEVLSVVVQVVSCKIRKKRVFLMSPIHHHFELSGAKEPKIMVRFWILAGVFSLLALATLKLR
ncbi:phospho-N-acetylmuramoyl-pentapeptide-transferase [bacterium Unc6]|nr:phospho-N-acetylmuramoyl-pentapeptide-transferase [bacterium Unc6]